jgi:hypothetical protein
VPGDLLTRGNQCVGVAWDGVVGHVATDDAPEPSALVGYRVMPVSAQLILGLAQLACIRAPTVMRLSMKRPCSSSSTCA